jgi:hypothetical protein
MIVVFTKYDQFRRDMIARLEDQGHDAIDTVLLNAEMERIYNKEFLAHLTDSPPVVCLESEKFVN